MGSLADYFNRNPITRNILIFSGLFVLLIAVFSFKGFEQVRVYGEILSTNQKIYGGRSIGVEDRAKALLSNGNIVTVTCDQPCPVGKNIELVQHLTVFGKKVYSYEGS
ncbi:hypothetical protein [Alteromonas sp. BMJM2]|uniref:hypothetical protein n=1 Tax=Alteromonas sp. BMJM2 TaxID=2954241 RepID=UPI0022B4E53A|nr:hypothetical protein [Alteromonas sp. BMJM2]